jgi:putative membrane protein
MGSRKRSPSSRGPALPPEAPQPPPSPRRHGRLLSWKGFELASFAAGTALLVWLLLRVGPAELARNLAVVGWGFFLVVALQAVPILLNTESWRLVLPPGRRIRLRALAPMLLAGEAVNAVSPVGVVGGELVRVSLLRRRLPTAAAVGAVGLAAITQFAAQVAFIFVGLPVAVVLLPRSGLRVVVALLATAIGAFLAAVLALAWSPDRLAGVRRALGRFGWFQRLRSRVPLAARDGLNEGLAALHERPAAFALSVSASFAAWQVGVIETLLILRLLGQPVGLARAVAIEVLAVAIEAVVFFVPARMGTQEGGRVLIFVALGLSPASGLALGLVRRARELAWAVPGLAILGHFQRVSRAADRPRPAAGVTRGGQPLPD